LNTHRSISTVYTYSKYLPMQKVDDIKELLYKVERSYAAARTGNIAALQEKIWDEPAIANEAIQQFLSDLAFDLNFYESNERDRDEALGYYGDERLLTIISRAIEKTEAFLHSPAS
jgi:hypothetical protein